MNNEKVILGSWSLLSHAWVLDCDFSLDIVNLSTLFMITFQGVPVILLRNIFG